MQNQSRSDNNGVAGVNSGNTGRTSPGLRKQAQSAGVNCTQSWSVWRMFKQERCAHVQATQLALSSQGQHLASTLHTLLNGTLQDVPGIQAAYRLCLKINHMACASWLKLRMMQV